MKTILNEISAIDAWNRFYNGKIDENIYNIIMNGVKQMDPFHKKVLDLFVKEKNSDDVAKLIANYWNGFNDNQKQIAIEDSKYYTSINILLEYLERLNTQKFHTENQAIDGGFVVIYDDEDIMVTCTTTYAANTKYYGFTHWCTASDLMGEYNGFNMFKRYVTSENSYDEVDKCLIQIVFKKLDRACKDYCYQANMFGDGESDTVCDAHDNGVYFREIYETAEKFNKAQTLMKVLESENYEKLINATEENLKHEAPFWNRKIKVKLENRRNNFISLDKKGVFNKVKDGIVYKIAEFLKNEGGGGSLKKIGDDDEGLEDVYERLNKVKAALIEEYKNAYKISNVAIGTSFDFVQSDYLCRAIIYFNPEIGNLSFTDYGLDDVFDEKNILFNYRTGEIVNEYSNNNNNGNVNTSTKLYNNLVFERYTSSYDDSEYKHSCALYYYDGHSMNEIFKYEGFLATRCIGGYFGLTDSNHSQYRIFNSYTGQEIKQEFNIVAFSRKYGAAYVEGAHGEEVELPRLYQLDEMKRMFNKICL